MKTFNFHSEPLQDGWLDAYGHLNEAYYLVPFTNANWAMQEHFDIGVPYFDETGCALYTLETHVRYVNEVRKPAHLDVETIILGFDPKRIWCAHMMVVNGNICATGEMIMLHYNTRESRTAPMPDATQNMLQDAVETNHPDWIGRRISLTGKQ